MKVLITGISGAAGSYLAEWINENVPGTEIHGIGRGYRQYQGPGTFWKCDMHYVSTVEHVVIKVKPDIVFNLAAQANVRQSIDEPEQFMRNNCTATVNLFEAVRRYARGAIVIHCSSSEVYGKPLYWPIPENHPCNPVNPYAVSKWVQEQWALFCHQNYGVPTIVTRAFGYINPRRPDLCASQWAGTIAQIEAGDDALCISYGNLESIRTYLDVRDVVRAYWMAATDGIPGQVYNIGSEKPVRVGDLFDKLRAMSRYQPTLCSEVYSLRRPNDVTNQIPDTAKFRQATKFKPQFTLDESLGWLLDHYRLHLQSPVLNRSA